MSKVTFLTYVHVCAIVGLLDASIQRLLLLIIFMLEINCLLHNVNEAGCTIIRRYRVCGSAKPYDNESLFYLNRLRDSVPSMKPLLKIKILV